MPQTPLDPARARGDRATSRDGGAWLSHEPPQRLDDAWPEVLVAHFRDRATRPLLRVGAVEKRFEGRGPGGDVAGRNHSTEAAPVDEVAENVAGRRHDGQAGPEAVEQPRAEGEAALEVVEVRRD